MAIGGIVGRNHGGTVTGCHFTGTVTRKTMYVGGIVGQNCGSATFTNCYNEAAVTGTRYTGGVVAQNHTGTTSKNTTVGTVTNCYNRGTIKGSTVGGVVGVNGNNYGTGTVSNSYYLSTSAVGGIGGSDVTGQAEWKSVAQFNSGEVSWLLQHKQSALVWVQEVVKTPKDPYPLMLNTDIGAGHPKVLRVTFKTEANSNYAIEYTNSGDTVPLPATPPMNEGFLFAEWLEENIDGVKFTGPVTGNDDLIVIAVQRELFGAEDPNTTVITTTYGRSAEKDLGEWVIYAGGSSSSGKFTYTITDYGGLTNATLDGSILTIPAGINAGEYTLTITAHEKEPLIVPLSFGSYGTSDVTLTVNVIVNKANLTADMFTFKPPDNLNCNGDPKVATVTLNEGYIGVGDTIKLNTIKTAVTLHLIHRQLRKVNTSLRLTSTRVVTTTVP